MVDCQNSFIQYRLQWWIYYRKLRLNYRLQIEWSKFRHIIQGGLMGLFFLFGFRIFLSDEFVFRKDTSFEFQSTSNIWWFVKINLPKMDPLGLPYNNANPNKVFKTICSKLVFILLIKYFL